MTESNNDNGWNLDLIFKDIETLSDLKEIYAEDFDEVYEKLESNEVKEYIDKLKYSKPEAALHDAFFAGSHSFLRKYLSKSLIPEVAEGEGFVDFLIKLDEDRMLPMEIKPLFDRKMRKEKSGRMEFRKIYQTKLNPIKHKKQILNYLKGNSNFLILTNLKDWFFFNKECSEDNFFSFLEMNLIEFSKEFEVEDNILGFIERKDKEYALKRGDLDKQFFESLKYWIGEFKKIKLIHSDEKEKLEIIINLLNKLIFIQTLDDFGVVEFRWLKKNWERFIEIKKSQGTLRFIILFFQYIKDFFYHNYDTELFRQDIVENIDNEPENLDLFYKTLHKVIGISYWQREGGGLKGIMQYNFKHIDEDVFGKAYEMFLADVRKEKGIYYTHNKATQYIALNSVKRTFQNFINNIKENIDADNFEKAYSNLKKLKTLKIIDPACGSGSFLIKSIRQIWIAYEKLEYIIGKRIRKLRKKRKGAIFGSSELENKIDWIQKMIDALELKNKRKLISQILLQHIYGNDLDLKAIEVAKVNIWLESIKLAPKEFRFDLLPKDTNHILPDLEMNFGCGDSLVGFSNELIKKMLFKQEKSKLKLLIKLRNKYIENPMNEEYISEIKIIKDELRARLNFLFWKSSRKVRPFHWAFEFWFVYFDENGVPLRKRDSGFDIVIGNPPWGAVLGDSENFILNSDRYSLAKGQFDIYEIFIELTKYILKRDGLLSFLIPDSIFLPEHEELRKLIATKYIIYKITKLGEGFFEDVFRSSVVILTKKNFPPCDHYLQGSTILKDQRELILKGDKKNTISKFENIFANKILQCRFQNKSNNFLFDITRSELDFQIKEKMNKEIIDWKIFKSSRGVESSGKIMRCPNCLLWDTIPKKVKGVFQVKKCSHCKVEYNYEDSPAHENIFDVTPDPKSKTIFPFVKGEHVNRYYFSNIIHIETDRKGINFKDPNLYKGGKILFRK
ncbi:MAG: Eco57I restriction-modification methylase domain-containing protein, partial [Promethearchaeota archaeon]